jgi:hypothetical protein
MRWNPLPSWPQRTFHFGLSPGLYHASTSRPSDLTVKNFDLSPTVAYISRTSCQPIMPLFYILERAYPGKLRLGVRSGTLKKHSWALCSAHIHLHLNRKWHRWILDLICLVKPAAFITDEFQRVTFISSTAHLLRPLCSALLRLGPPQLMPKQQQLSFKDRNGN